MGILNTNYNVNVFFSAPSVINSAVNFLRGIAICKLLNV